MSDDLATWVRDEQISLWYDLGQAINYAANGKWSMAAANIALRIVSAARLVGPSPVGEVPWSLVAGGVYDAVLSAGNVPHEMPDEAEMQRVDDLMARQGATTQTREQAVPAFAGTVAAIKTEAETAYILDGAE